MTLDIAGRRALARELSRIANASVDDILASPAPPPVDTSRRIGFTGPPGVGKSTLVAEYAKARAGADVDVGILAIDPASPYTQGAVLGDRIRVAAATDDQRIFMRSLSSRDSNDGLCNNVPDLLSALERAGCVDVLLETVGVGQAEHAIRALVDTVVLLLQPETGDAIQALKAGILETADIVVIAKSDLPGAARLREHTASSLQLGKSRPTGWQVPIVPVSVTTNMGLDALAAAIDLHGEWRRDHVDALAVANARAAYRLRELIVRRIDTHLAASVAAAPGDIAAAYRALVASLDDAAGRRG